MMTTPAELKTEIARMRASLDGLAGIDAADRELLQKVDRIFPSDDPRTLASVYAIVSGLSRKHARSRNRPRLPTRASASRGGMR